MIAQTIFILCLLLVSVTPSEFRVDHSQDKKTPKPSFTLYNNKGAPYSKKLITSQSSTYCEFILSGPVFSDLALTKKVGSMYYKTWFTADYYAVEHTVFLKNGSISYDNWIPAPEFTYDFSTCSAGPLPGKTFKPYFTAAIGAYVDFYAPNPGYVISQVVSPTLRKVDFYHA